MFSNLSYQDKQAFFGLLDEYFASRPHLTAGNSSGPSIPLSAVAPMARIAANASNGTPHDPKDTAAASKGLSSLFSSLRVPSSGSPAAAPGPATPTSPPAYPSGPAAGSSSSLPLSNSSSPPPVAEKKKLTKEEKAEIAQIKREQMVVRAGIGALKMATGSARTGLGMVARNDKMMEALGPAAGAVRSADNAVGKSLPFQKKKKAPEPPAQAQAAQPVPAQQMYQASPTSPVSPPPQRTLAPPQRKAPAVAAVAVVQQENEAEGQAQALYDYEGGDSGDLSVQGGQIVNVLEKTSADWWTCEDGNGERGLVPANYLKEI